MLPYRGLSVMFVHCAQTAEDIDTISFVYDSPMSIPDRIKIWLMSVSLFLDKFCLTASPTHMTCPGPISWHVLPPSEYDRRYRQGRRVLCWIMSRWCRLCPNYFGPCLFSVEWVTIVTSVLLCAPCYDELLIEVALPLCRHRLNNVFVIGKGNKPWVSLPRGKGVKLSIAEERDRRIQAKSQ